MTRAEPHRGDRFNYEKLGGPGLRTFFGIAEAWELSEQEQMKLLGLTSLSTLLAWQAGDISTVSRDVLERISYVLGIFKGIGTLLPEPSRADRWMRAPNSAALFGGRSPLDRMTAGNVSDLYRVRQYIDDQLS